MKDNKEVFTLVQLIISADIILHKYSRSSVKKKIELLKELEKLKKLKREL